MNFFGIDGAEFLVLVIVGLLLIGPVRAARALLGLRALIDRLRGYSATLREQSGGVSLASALGVDKETFAKQVGLDELEIDDFSIDELDPRKYIRQAVREEMEAWATQSKDVSRQLVQASDPAKKPSTQKQQQDTSAEPNNPSTDKTSEQAAETDSPSTGSPRRPEGTLINPSQPHTGKPELFPDAQ